MRAPFRSASIQHDVCERGHFLSAHAERLIVALGSSLSIDLGTANTLISCSHRGIVLREPSVVALACDRNGVSRLIAAGLQAYKMLGRAPKQVRVVRPLRDGVISDFSAAELMIGAFVQQVRPRFALGKKQTIVSSPIGATPVERRAILESTRRASGGRVATIDEPVAAAMGAGLPISDSRASMVVDIGGGTTEVAALSLGGVAAAASCRIGGDAMDRAVRDFIRSKYNMLIGLTNAERLKRRECDASAGNSGIQLEVKGVNLASGLPMRCSILRVDIEEALAASFDEIARTVRVVLADMPPELCGDILEFGVTLTGGGAHLPGLASYISSVISAPTTIAADPLTCVVRGAQAAMLQFEELFAVERSVS